MTYNEARIITHFAQQSYAPHVVRDAIVGIDVDKVPLEVATSKIHDLISAKKTLDQAKVILVPRGKMDAPPLLIFKNSDVVLQQNEICGICFCELSDATTPSTCSHKFCKL